MKAIVSGSAVVQAMIIKNPDDRTVSHIDDQYYFGDSFLVCPVMNSENRRDVYLPEGKWVDFFSGEVLEGSRWLKDVEVPLENTPVYVKYGTELPFYPEPVDCTDEMNLSKTVSIRIDESFKGIWSEKLFNE